MVSQSFIYFSSVSQRVSGNLPWRRRGCSVSIMSGWSPALSRSRGLHRCYRIPSRRQQCDHGVTRRDVTSVHTWLRNPSAERAHMLRGTNFNYLTDFWCNHSILSRSEFPFEASKSHTDLSIEMCLQVNCWKAKVVALHLILQISIGGQPTIDIVKMLEITCARRELIHCNQNLCFEGRKFRMTWSFLCNLLGVCIYIYI